MASDEDLLHSFANGRRDALGALAERYERPLLNLACAILGSSDLAVDAVQETWLRVIRHAGSFNGRSGVKTWLYRIAINQCRSQLSARQAVDSIESDGSADDDESAARVPPNTDAAEQRAAGFSPRGPSDAKGRALSDARTRSERPKSPDPAAEAARRDEADQLKQAVERLSPPLREAVLLCYTHGLTHEEAAEALGIPLGTVKSRVHAALEQLRSALAAKEAAQRG